LDIECPQCHARFEAPDRVAGRKARCGACKTVFEVPAPSESEDAYELAQPFEEVVASRPHVPVSPPPRPAPESSKDEEAHSLPVRCLLFVGYYIPGLFRPKALILSIICTVLGFGILGLAMFIALLGGLLSAFVIGGFGLICYSQALAMLLHGEVVMLSEALSELNAWQWLLFILLLVAPFAGAIAYITSRLAGQ